MTVSVLDLDKVNRTSVSPNDLKIEWFSGTGAGGQHRNKHQNSCRITYLPTGLTVAAQTRSRESSLAQAMATLTSKIEESSRSDAHTAMASVKQKQMGTGMRGDKMRTYRFKEDSVTDHKSGRTATCKEVMRGSIDKLWSKVL